MVATFGAMTVPAVYTLGRIVAGHGAGLLAALLTMTSPVLVLVSSHYGWSNSLTPFFATVTLIAVYVGATERRAGAMFAGGVLAGLTVQTHPLSFVVPVGITFWYFGSVPPREWLWRRETYAWVAGVATGYSPMLWSFAMDWNRLIAGVEAQSYAFAPSALPIRYLERVPAFLSGAYNSFYGGTLAIVCIATVAAVVDRRRHGRSTSREWKPFLPTVCAFSALLPLVTVYFPTRYLGFLIPVVLVWASGVLAKGHQRWLARPLGARRRFWLAAFMAIDLFVGGNALAFRLREGQTNESFFHVRDTLRNNDGCADGVFVENVDAAGLAANDAIWTYFNVQSVRFPLVLDSCAVTTVDTAELIDRLANDPLPSWLVISEATVPIITQRFHLDRIVPVTAGPAVSAPMRMSLFRVASRQP
jgi:4-amino-4-deoxy-L-arabinose transferase-like glycosyltransferase